jgi:uncharacterized membrane protein
MKRVHHQNSKTLENENGGKYPVKRILVPIIFAFILLGSLMVTVTLFSENAEADSYEISINWKNPIDGTADVTPGAWQTYDVDVENEGQNFGYTVNLTAEFTDPNKETQGWSVSPPSLQFGLDQNQVKPWPIKIRPPSNASYEDDATVRVYVEVDGHAENHASLTLYANVEQVYEVTNEVKNKDNRHNVSVELGATDTTFSLNITNSGNGVDSFDLTYSGVPLGWPNPSFSSDSVNSLPSGDTAPIQFQVYIPANAQSTTYTINTFATSQGNPAQSSSATVNVRVLPKYRSTISTIPPSSSGNPGDTVNYQITISNTGNIAEDFLITHTVIEGEAWSSGISVSANQHLDYQQNLTFTLSVTIDSDASEDKFNRVEVKISSFADPTKNSSVIIRTDVDQVYGVLVSSPTKQFADPEEEIYYIVNIRNTGNGEDTINIVTSGAFGGGTANNTLLLNMQPDEIRSINVTVKVDKFAPAGIQEITVTGNSENDPEVPAASDYGTIQIDVNERFEVTLIANGLAQKSGEPGGDIVPFEIRVINDGTGTDDILLDMDSEKLNWATLSPSFVNDLAHREKQLTSGFII